MTSASRFYLYRNPACLVPVLALLVALSSGARASEAWHWLAQGDQVYRCAIDGPRPAWVLDRPDATLVDGAGVLQGRHGAGPSWTALDGSIVGGAVALVMPAPRGDAIPWLALRAVRNEGTGTMAGVAFILRQDTQGGVAPSSGCDVTASERELRVPYTARYTFIPAPVAP